MDIATTTERYSICSISFNVSRNAALALVCSSSIALSCAILVLEFEAIGLDLQGSDFACYAFQPALRRDQPFLLAALHLRDMRIEGDQ